MIFPVLVPLTPSVLICGCVWVWVAACKIILQQQASRLYKLSFQHIIRQFENKKHFSLIGSLLSFLLFAHFLSFPTLFLCLQWEAHEASPHRAYPDCFSDTFTSSLYFNPPSFLLQLCSFFFVPYFSLIRQNFAFVLLFSIFPWLLMFLLHENIHCTFEHSLIFEVPCSQRQDKGTAKINLCGYKWTIVKSYLQL